MKLQLFTMSNKILFFFIGLLGFSISCTKRDARYYGTSYAKFGLTVNGLTRSINSKQGIPNIKVSLHEIKTDQQGAILDTITLDSTYTANNGQFVLFSNEKSNSYIINLRDIDSTKNGSYKDKDTTIVVSKVDYENVDGKSDAVSASKYLYFFLEPKP